MKPYLHGLVSVKKFGGKVDDYQQIHDWFDQCKAHVPDMRHRAILHNSFGIYLCEQYFGTTITNSDGKVVSVRDVGEQHVLDDLGTIPTLQDYLTHLPWLDWLGGPKRAKGVKADEVEPATATQQPIVLPKPLPSDALIDGGKPFGIGIGAIGQSIRDMVDQQRRIQDLQGALTQRRPNWPDAMTTVTD